MNAHECFSDNIAALSNNLTSPLLWKVWPTDAIENGAPEWRAEKGGWYTPIASQELEESIQHYLQQPWLAHPTLDWSLIGGWLFNAARNLRDLMETNLISHDDCLDYRSFSNRTAAEEDQMFVSGEDLKADLAALASHYEGLPKEEIIRDRRHMQRIRLSRATF